MQVMFGWSKEERERVSYDCGLLLGQSEERHWSHIVAGTMRCRGASRHRCTVDLAVQIIQGRLVITQKQAFKTFGSA